MMTGAVSIHMPTPGNDVFIKQQAGKAGDVVHTHRHDYEHYSILASGMAVVEKDGKEEVLTGPTVIIIEAGVAHKITFLTDTAWFCVHGTKETDESKFENIVVGA